jgi:hypothetical protein
MNGIRCDHVHSTAAPTTRPGHRRAHQCDRPIGAQTARRPIPRSPSLFDRTAIRGYGMNAARAEALAECHQCPALALAGDGSTRCPSPSDRVAWSLARSFPTPTSCSLDERDGERTDRCRMQHHACAPDAVQSYPHAQRVHAGHRGKAAVTRAAPLDGASCARPNCAHRRSARQQAADCSRPRSTTLCRCRSAATAGTSPTWPASVTGITPPRTSSTASAAGPDRDDREPR